MALKFRMQRFGRKGCPFYHVVVTDSRNARDGRFIERVGHYDPVPELSTVELKTDRLVHWYAVGARPSSAVETLLRIKKIDLPALVKTKA